VVSISHLYYKTAQLFRTGRQGIVRIQAYLGGFQLVDLANHYRLGVANFQFAGDEVDQEARDDDERTEEQTVVLGGEQMYQALKRLGRTTELVVYPGEYHEFKTPSHIKDRLERYLAWYARYVKGDSTPACPAPLLKSVD